MFRRFQEWTSVDPVLLQEETKTTNCISTFPRFAQSTSEYSTRNIQPRSRKSLSTQEILQTNVVMDNYH